MALRAAGAGAADAWLTPILMKKGSPAHTLSVLAGPDQAATLRRLVFTETSTIGLRERRVAQYELVRNVDTMSVDGEQIWVKLAWLDEPLVNTQPEHDDAAAAARALDRPVKAVTAQAVAVRGGRKTHPRLIKALHETSSDRRTMVRVEEVQTLYVDGNLNGLVGSDG